MKKSPSVNLILNVIIAEYIKEYKAISDLCWLQPSHNTRVMKAVHARMEGDDTLKIIIFFYRWNCIMSRDVTA